MKRSSFFLLVQKKKFTIIHNNILQCKHFNIRSLLSLTLHANVQILLALPSADKQTMKALGGLQSLHMLGAHTLSHAYVHAHTVGLKVNNLLMEEKNSGRDFPFHSLFLSLTHLRQGSAVTYEIGQLSLSGQRMVHDSCANPSVSTSYGRVSRHFPGYGAPSRWELH